MNFKEKIPFFTQATYKDDNSYAVSFQGHIYLISENNDFCFLKYLKSKKEITVWIDKLKSRLVMKEDMFEIDEIIEDYIELG